MIDVLKTLSSLIKSKKPVQKQNDLHATQSKEKPVAVISATQTILPTTPVQSPQQIANTSAILIEAQAKLQIAEAKAKELMVEAKDEAMRIRRDAEDEIRRKLEVLDRKEGALEEREKRSMLLEEDARKRLNDIEKIKQDQIGALERAAHLTRDEAREQILTALRDKLKEQVAKEIKEAEIKARDEAELKAKEILIDAMRHGATDYVAEYSVSVVKITDEEMKGRIIGKEGRNIRAFEMATGVDVDLDEEGVIRLSCFDPVRRETARVTLERLMKDGRVQPGRIEEIVAQVKKELDRIMFEEGQKLCHAVGVYNLPAPLVAMLGRFKYRFSYGQNMIAHTLEETKIGIALAQEIKTDANVVRLGCLLHDIGKVITDQEGTHVELGVQLLKKYGIPQKVIDCVAQHHEDTQFSSAESMVVYISDAISGSRPGARYEDYEGYIKRLTDLETIAKAQHGVKEAFAFQAGRELRVMIDPGVVADAEATIIAHDIKEEIEKKVTFPGQIKVTVIRELRVTEVAK